MLMLWFQSGSCTVFAVLLLTSGSAAVAIADVTIDACVAQNSINHPSLAADMQSLGGLSSSVGGLLGFSISGILLHAFDSKVSKTFYSKNLFYASLTFKQKLVS